MGSTFAAVMLCAVLAACAGGPGKHPANPANPPEGVFTPRRIVFIGFDGLGGAYVPQADMPALKRMIAGGASSMDVQNVMPSNSWPNWSSLFYGAPPEVQAAETLPSLFTLASGAGQRAALFYEWGELQRLCGDGEAEKRRIDSTAESARKIAAYIREHKPRFTAVIFNEPDSTGHGRRWGSPAYYAKLAEMDGLIGLIEEGVKEAGLYDTTVFVLASDHGGILWGHGFNTPRQRRIPLVVYGQGIREGFTIPGPVSICDIAPTMAAILGLKSDPRWTGRALGEIAGPPGGKPEPRGGGDT